MKPRTLQTANILIRFFNKLRERAALLKHEITALWYACRDPAVGFLPKLIVILTVAYALSPVDLIPDFIPVLGYLDDLLILPAMIALAIALIPRAVMDDARARATAEPISMRSNWIAGALFIAVWLVILAVLVRALVRIFSD